MLKIDIINLALTRLGESPIQSVDEASPAANAAKLLYDTVRRSVLRDYDWNFALKEVGLSRYTTPKRKDYHYSYALPVDCVRVIKLVNSSGFAVSDGSLHTDSEEAQLLYIWDNDDEHTFDSKFVEALSYKLASELAMPVKGAPELMSSYSNAYLNLVKDAATESINERYEELDDNPYITARYV
jgi:hypothetical protein